MAWVVTLSIRTKAIFTTSMMDVYKVARETREEAIQIASSALRDSWVLTGEDPIGKSISTWRSLCDAAIRGLKDLTGEGLVTDSNTGVGIHFMVQEGNPGINFTSRESSPETFRLKTLDSDNLLFTEVGEVKHERAIPPDPQKLLEEIEELNNRIAMLEAELSNSRGPVYTCIGKGGRYELLGPVIGAGTARGYDGVVYRDLENERLMFLRWEADFSERMEAIKE